ncbi:DoxX family protein [Streptomyces sp. TRM 70361]|uniref:DoxX family protein n=1 Tax=Streptomyces sp. TRM 70361 TaxID=3116553 RepID=UPI002E7ABD8C|nr:DoxX family protein [Streptomyces sp. TRM 70361]MEE1942291.1 DoxX family protein [Streptomyces sp. TRM 70361]
MSVDTRTHREPGPSGSSSGGPPGKAPGRAPGGKQRGFLEDEPVLTMVRVPSDPAQVTVNHASFRVEFASPPPYGRLVTTGAGELTGLAGVRGATRVRRATAGRPARRRAPVVWSGRTEPGDVRTARLLQALRRADGGTDGRTDGGHRPGTTATRTLPRVPAQPGPAPQGGPSATAVTQALPVVPAAPAVVPPQGARPRPPGRPLLDGLRPAEGAYDVPEGEPPYRLYRDDPYDPYETHVPHGPDHPAAGDGTEPAAGTDGADGADAHRRGPARHGYQPGRRTNLGAVLLPLRILLGLICVQDGIGRLCDPRHLAAGGPGSLADWLRAMRPWAVAEPLHGLVLAHPVGAGLTAAFLQIVVGVLTLLGLWQRAAAGCGVLLSVAALAVAGWRAAPVYEAADLLRLAAWSPLVIAGAPYYSLDSRLAGDAWRKLGPRVEPGELRRRVLRRGAVVATVVLGLTLLIGSVLGSAVRSARVVTVPEPGGPLTNNQPGSPLPRDPGGHPGPSGPGRESRLPGGGPAGSAPPSPSGPGSRSTEPGGTDGTDGAGDTGRRTGTPGRERSGEATRQWPEPPPAVSEPQPRMDRGATGGSAEAVTGGGTGGGGEQPQDDGHEPEAEPGALGGLLG